MATKKAAKKATTPKHGGKREGAGRKPRYEEAVVSRSITLPPRAWSKLDELANGSASEWVLKQIMHADLRS